MPRDPTKGRTALRRGRVSIPNAEYFLTVCTDARRPGLTKPMVATVILAGMRAMEADSTWQLRCAVVMPDHIHLLIILRERLTLGKSIARLKSETSSALASVGSALDWERDFYDHHVRPDDDHLALFLYIFLNPYRANLCPRDERWPWYFCRDEDWAWFHGMLDADRPFPEWLEPL